MVAGRGDRGPRCRGTGLVCKECGNGRQEEERTRLGGRWFGMVVCAVLAHHGRLTAPVSAEHVWKAGRSELVAP